MEDFLYSNKMFDNRIFKENNYHGFVGIAEVDITPPVGIYARNWGAAKYDQSIGNHNSLKLSCVTISQKLEETAMVMVSLDAGVWRSYEVRVRILNHILEYFSLPKENLVFCLTHTHAGPVLSDELDEKLGGEINRQYISILQDKIIEVIAASLDNRSLSIITWKYGKCALARNRDLYIKEENRYVTGFNPVKAADDTLLVGRIQDLITNKVKGVIVNYACHPTTLAWTNQLVSADYVGEMRNLIQNDLDCPVLFIQGASGELAPQYQYTDDLQIVKRNGKILGYAVLAVLEEMIPADQQMYFKNVVVSGADLAEWDFSEQELNRQLSADVVEVDFELKNMPTLQNIISTMETDIPRVEYEKLFRLKNLRIQFGDNNSAKISVWVWQIGDAILIGQQNEAYSDFQQKIRSALGEKCVLIGNLVNGSAGYLPPKELYDEDCYTVIQTPFAVGGLENLIEQTLSFIKRFK